MTDLTQEQLDQFTDVMVEKCKLHGSIDETPEETFRSQIQNVIVDTELLVTGGVPLDRWLGDPRQT